MIRHIVLLKFKTGVSNDIKEGLMEELSALRTHLSGIIDFKHGANISPETPVIHGFEDGFWFDFKDQAARDTYLADPKHKAVGAKLVAQTDGGLNGLIVFDLEM